MTTELDSLSARSSSDGLHTETTNKRRISGEDLSLVQTPISPARSPALVNKLESTQSLFANNEVRKAEEFAINL